MTPKSERLVSDSVAFSADPPAHLLLAAVREPAALVDDAGRVLGWNAAAQIEHGIAVSDAVGRNLADLVAGPSSATAPGGRYANAIELPVVLTGDRAGSLVVWQAEPPEALATSEILAERMRAIGRLAAGLRHELNNPLAAILGFASLLAVDPRLDEGLRADVGLLRSEAEQTRRLIELLLDLVRVRPSIVQPASVASVVGAVLDLQAYALTDVSVALDIPAQLPPVDTDADQLRTALLHLTLNAITAMGAAGRDAEADGSKASLRIAARASRAGGIPTVRITLDDSAPTVPEEQRGRLFAARPAPRAGERRQGLDLPVACRLIVDAGGRLRYQPGPAGWGNRFVLELPIEAGAALPATAAAGLADASHRPAERSARPRPASAPAPAPTGGPDAMSAGTRAAVPVVVVVDDEPVVRALLGRVLERNGYEAIVVESGPELLRFVEHRSVDVILSDHRMSDMNGAQLYAIVASRWPQLARRFVLMSGDANNADLAAFVSEAGIPVIAKPFEVSTIVATVRMVLDRDQAE